MELTGVLVDGEEEVLDGRSGTRRRREGEAVALDGGVGALQEVASDEGILDRDIFLRKTCYQYHVFREFYVFYYL